MPLIQAKKQDVLEYLYVGINLWVVLIMCLIYFFDKSFSLKTIFTSEIQIIFLISSYEYCDY